MLFVDIGCRMLSFFGMRIAALGIMMKFFRECIARSGSMDFAVLFMRLFAGGMMLLHNIGKIQNYNEIIGSYPSFLFIEQQAVFAIVTTVEVLLALLIVVGLWVRAAAFWMAAGILALLAWSGFEDGELRFVWLGVYLFWSFRAAVPMLSIGRIPLGKEKIELSEQYSGFG